MSTAIDAQSPVTNPAPKPRIHLDYLDAIRALAAIVVILHHAYGFAIGDNIGKFPHVFHRIYHALLYAHYAVDIFIVLSGYVLMLPVVKSIDGQLQGGMKAYLHRRAWRILPPYYAAVAFSLILVECMVLVQRSGWNTGEVVRHWTLAGLASYLFLVHNLNPAWSGQINAAMWSVATEWQIYFIFPLLLLPIWRRFGIVAAVVLSFCATVLPYMLHPHGAILELACPWYVTLFALGMSAAVLNYSQAPLAESLRRRLPWRALPWILLVTGGVLFKVLSGAKAHWIEDALLGFLVAGFLAYLAWAITASDTQTLPKGLRLLQSKWLVGLGRFSYSIYLVHMPVLGLLRTIIPTSRFAPVVQFVLLLPCEILAAIAVAYAFHVVFERPFLSSKGREKMSLNSLRALLVKQA